MKRHNVLAPLDGSIAADTAVPYAVALAQACGLGIELLSVVMPLGDGPHAAGLEALLTERLHAHLHAIAENLRPDGITVETAVRTGDPSDVILTHAEKLRSRALVMTTHGHGGLQAPTMGGVADKALRLAPCPVLLIRPDGRSDLTMMRWRPRRLLVPLDGSPAAEDALPQAYELAAALNAEVVLARVQPWLAAQLGDFHGYLPNVAQMDEEAARTAADYLRARRLSAPARLVVREVVLRGNPAERLRDFARAGGVDLIVMTAHGHAGTRRSALGSVTDRLARQGLPLFIVRPLTADTDQGHAVGQEQLETERPSVAGLTEAG